MSKIILRVAIVAVIAAYANFGPLLLAMWGIIDYSETMRAVVLYVTGPVFIISVVTLKILSWLENRRAQIGA